MLGHEGVRRLTEAHLAALMPAKLAEIRDRFPPVDVDNSPAVWPPNPHVMCADEFPERSDKLPAVIVTSAQLLGMDADEAGAAPEWVCTYQFDIGVICVSPNAGGLELASIGRDRLLLAVREICITDPDVGHGVTLRCRDLTEETGPGKQDSASRPLAAGLVSLQAEAIETLTDTTFGPITEFTTTITAVDARQPIPIPEEAP